MKRLFIPIISTALFIAFTFSSKGQDRRIGANGQDYQTGIGVRLGGLTSGITVKHFTNPTGAIEGIASFGHRSFILTGLYEKHADINNAPGLKWYYGGGAHIGFFSYDGYYYYDKHHYYYYYGDRPGDSHVVGGVDLILGLEYKFKDAPFSLGLDMKPFIDFFDGVYGYFDGALSFRFAF